MGQTGKLTLLFTISIILISTVMAKDLRPPNSYSVSDNNIEVDSPKSKNDRKGRMFWNLFRRPMPPYYPPQPPFMGVPITIMPPYHPQRPSPIWAAFQGAGSFVTDMLDILTSAVAEMHFDGTDGGPYDGGSDYGGSDYGGEGGDYEGGGGDYSSWGGGGGYDDSSSDSGYDGGDDRSLPMPPPY